ncbi:SDR family NAD(P)-dependent oxidoreductase [Polaromonas sp. JS666]|uniref:SDR family NAD(P)-dependent oxidoreductase n=1 Tax=Polaromonas sp. (strain JS666 / ATCC BAA-500) TaxID=296591 RepID=UPI00088C60A1|nr:SDR family oxidoreductase [Polaromonas sp. JS666]SDO08755.1 NAD(P)-dependent dehydrogenase, short-chain alcohol dehydrogenase family [Polaromonas sp. JS666]
MTEQTRYPSLKGKSVFISGGATGIGACLVEHFAAQGAKVGFVDIDTEGALALQARLAREGLPGVHFEECDVTDTPRLRSAIGTLRQRIGAIQVLVNNAANDQRHLIEETTPESWDSGVAVNLKHYFFAAQEVFKDMKALGGGSIINFGSVSWMVKTGGMPVYTTCKSAVQGLTRSLARDFGAHRIRVNTVVPGWVMTEKQIRLWVTPQAKAELAKAQCLPGELAPADLARAVLFLASDDSSMITAHDLVVDGGWT